MSGNRLSPRKSTPTNFYRPVTTTTPRVPCQRVQIPFEIRQKFDDGYYYTAYLVKSAPPITTKDGVVVHTYRYYFDNQIDKLDVRQIQRWQYDRVNSVAEK